VERITRRTAAKRTVDHVWRRLPVNARDELAIGAGGATKALQEKVGIRMGKGENNSIC